MREMSLREYYPTRRERRYGFFSRPQSVKARAALEREL
jgi:hypothetical protein